MTNVSLGKSPAEGPILGGILERGHRSVPQKKDFSSGELSAAVLFEEGSTFPRKAPSCSGLPRTRRSSSRLMHAL